MHKCTDILRNNTNALLVNGDTYVTPWYVIYLRARRVSLIRFVQPILINSRRDEIKIIIYKDQTKPVSFREKIARHFVQNIALNIFFIRTSVLIYYVLSYSKIRF